MGLRRDVARLRGEEARAFSSGARARLEKLLESSRLAAQRNVEVAREREREREREWVWVWVWVAGCSAQC